MARSARFIDIDEIPELLRIVEQLEADRARIVFRRSHKEVAILDTVRPDDDDHFDIADEDLAAFQSSAGSWSDVDTDAFIDYVSSRRRSSSRPEVDL